MNPVPDIAWLQTKAAAMRATCVQLAFDGKVGHLGSALSCVEGVVALYYRWLNLSPATIRDPDRDRFILSKGHACTAQYAALADRGFIPMEWLETYACKGAPLSDHPCRHALDLLECSTGSLGHGLGIATGMLYGLRLRGSTARAAVILSDGECNEGSVWESAMFAAAKGLENLVALVDYNRIQAVGRSDEIMGHTSLEEKFRAFGWGAVTVDGNDMAAVVDALDRFPLSPGRPSAIVLRTEKGAGVSFMRDRALWHYRVPSANDLRGALAELGAEPIHRRGGER
jgi:transketolase